MYSTSLSQIAYLSRLRTWRSKNANSQSRNWWFFNS